MRIGTVIAAFGGFIAGFAIGGSISYFVSESKFNKKMDADYILKREEERKAEIEDVKEEPTEKQEQIKETVEVPADATYRDVSSVLSSYQGKENHVVNYAGYSEPEDDEENEKDMAPVERDDRPYIISEDDYNLTFIEFTKRELSYYGRSHDLIDERDGSEVSPADTVGVENLITLKKAGTLYIRSIPNGEDYEVKYIDGSMY